MSRQTLTATWTAPAASLATSQLVAGQEVVLTAEVQALAVAAAVRPVFVPEAVHHRASEPALPSADAA